METTESFENKTKSVLKHLQENKSINSWEAITLYKATRLAATIFDLKEQGHSITTEIIQDGRRRYAVYHYVGEDVLENGIVLGK
jgi:hypothetical protein